MLTPRERLSRPGRLIDPRWKLGTTRRRKRENLTARKRNLNSHNDVLLGLLLIDQPALDQKLLDLQPLVALELENLAKVVGLGRGGLALVVAVRRGHDGAVACKLLLHGLEKLLRVVLVRQALDGGERLSAISLLETWCE